MSKGKLIVIDGGDGAGKKTQTKLLVEHLTAAGQAVVSFDFPQYQNNVFGKLIRECLDGKRGDFLELDPRIASALYAADRFESAPAIRRWLEEGKIVVVDRYVSSNMLHQGGKIDDAPQREEFLSWLDSMEHEVFEVPRPDMVIYCSVDPKTRMELLAEEAKRSAVATDVAENSLDHQERADIAARHVVEKMNNWHTVECMRDGALRAPEDISEEIYAIVMSQL